MSSTTALNLSNRTINRDAGDRSYGSHSPRDCEARPHPANDLLLRAVFAVVFTGIVIGLLTYSGAIKSSSNNTCPHDGSYDMCSFKQDLRSVFSFAAGAFLCARMGKQGESERPCPQRSNSSNAANPLERVKLYTYML
eukprot:TRINITY_DN11538_c0_g4_i1.p1 TRINITY_DN11538_c0_g4~~TRINITY_DN11538_c0_g4_i1.p1  ORF type:complete len:138 (-),score=13.93 TRINITY_DN11538_c0_g4_i1:471-884(-)